MSIDVAILGATGVVGQKAIALLQNHPIFRVKELVASERRVGMCYRDGCDWRESGITLPEEIGSIKLKSADDLGSKFIISCLPTDIAQVDEPKLASQGRIVFSNASAFRMNENVPLLVPEINESHLKLLPRQNTIGKIITNPNCVAVGVVLALAPLMEIGEIEHVSVVSLQSASGAGYPGVPSLDLLGNTIPHIEGEAEKIAEETKKILGAVDRPAAFAVTANVHRVPVAFGHTVTLHITFANNVNREKAIACYNEWNKKHNQLFMLHEQAGRPQSIRDLTSNDMRVHIGHLKLGAKANMLTLVALSHNLVRGAAGAVIANMESYLRFPNGGV